jgi:hypothetical protein
MAGDANKKHKIRRDPAKMPLILIKIAVNFFLSAYHIANAD